MVRGTSLRRYEDSPAKKRNEVRGVLISRTKNNGREMEKETHNIEQGR
jgi:hypothetical protein